MISTPLPAVVIERRTDTLSTIYFPKRPLELLAVDEDCNVTLIKDKMIDPYKDVIVTSTHVVPLSPTGEESYEIPTSEPRDVSLWTIVCNIREQMANWYNVKCAWNEKRIRSKKLCVQKIKLIHMNNIITFASPDFHLVNTDG